MEAAPRLDLCKVLFESKIIINAHTRHFLALSVFFLLPLSFSITSFPTLHNLLLSNSLVHNSQVLLRHTIHHHHYHDEQTIPIRTVLLSLAFLLFVFLFSLFAIASITYSVFHGFYGRPVKLLPTIKSISSSFLPILTTLVLYLAIVLLTSVVFAIIFLLITRGIEFLGFQIDYSSSYFVAFALIVLLLLSLVLVNLQVHWTLMPVISVIESSWGFQPLRRSAYLIEGMRRIALYLFLLFGALAGILMWFSSIFAQEFYGASDGWKRWAFVLQIMVTSILLMLLLLYSAAANTVLYMYCKAIHGELALEIVEEFVREYVSLPFDHEKLPHFVSVVHP